MVEPVGRRAVARSRSVGPRPTDAAAAAFRAAPATTSRPDPGGSAAQAPRRVPWRPLPEPRGEELPRPIADGLDTVARRLGVARPAVLSVVFRRWPEIAGDVIARHVRPVGVRAGILYLEADDAAWAQEVTFLGDELRSRLAVALGTVERLELRVKVARPASARPSTRRRPSRSDGD